jgi:hypothetical protein
MTDKTTISRAFNTHFFELMDDIVSIFPDNNEILSAKESFLFIKRGNPTIIIKAWYLHIYVPYSSVIEAGDIRFFFEKDYSTDLSGLANVNSVMEIIDKIRKPVSEMNEANQASTMKYIQNLCKLSVIYNGL